MLFPGTLRKVFKFRGEIRGPRGRLFRVDDEYRYRCTDVLARNPITGTRARTYYRSRLSSPRRTGVNSCRKSGDLLALVSKDCIGASLLRMRHANTRRTNFPHHDVVSSACEYDAPENAIKWRAPCIIQKDIF